MILFYLFIIHFIFIFFKGQKGEGEVILFLLFLKEGGQISKRAVIWGKINPKMEKDKIKEEGGDKRWGNSEEKERGKG